MSSRWWAGLLELSLFFTIPLFLALRELWILEREKKKDAALAAEEASKETINAEESAQHH